MKSYSGNIISKDITPFQIAILLLSFYVLFALLFQLVFRPSNHIIKILDSFDFVVCMVFLYDFFYRFATSNNKLNFLKWGWIDFVSSIPTISFLRWGRLIRIIRVLRLLRAFRSTKTIIIYLFQNRAQNTLAIAALISFFLVLFSSIAILHFETSPNAHIQTIMDAMWWSFSSISSTGSGNAYPISVPGKILAIILSITGIGLFGTLTAYVAKFFIEPEQKHEDKEIEILKNKIDEINRKLDLITHKIINK
jgi:voltage-gated potassium channel